MEKEYIERNNAIVKDKLEKKLTYRKLSEIYGISPERIRQIVRKAGRKQGFDYNNMDDFLNHKFPQNYDFFYDFSKRKEGSLSTRTVNVLKRGNQHRLEDIMKLTKESLLTMNNVGKKTTKEILDFIESMAKKTGEPAND